MAKEIVDPEPRRRKRVSKKTKKGWRRASKVDDVEEFLEQTRADERTGVSGGNSRLYFIDNLKDSSRKKSSADLKCHQGLKLDSSIPPVHVSQKVFKPVAKPVKSTASKAVSKTTSKRRPASRAPYDLWSTDLTPSEEMDEHFAKVCKKQRVKPPPKYRVKPSAIETFEIPHPGASYNPLHDDHQALLKKAIEIEEKKEKCEMKLKQALDNYFPATSSGSSEAIWLKEMSVGLTYDDKEKSEKNANDSKDDSNVVSTFQSGVERKKTEKQRRLEKERHVAERRCQKEKEQKLRENEKFRLKSIKKELKLREMKLATRAAWKELERQENRNMPKKLGRLNYEEPVVNIQLTEELSDSLRQVKPEGHIAEIMFKHLQKKNIIEPRKRAKPLKRCASKLFEKKGHRTVAL